MKPVFMHGQCHVFYFSTSSNLYCVTLHRLPHSDSSCIIRLEFINRHSNTLPSSLVLLRERHFKLDKATWPPGSKSYLPNDPGPQCLQAGSQSNSTHKTSECQPGSSVPTRSAQVMWNRVHHNFSSADGCWKVACSCQGFHSWCRRGNIFHAGHLSLKLAVSSRGLFSVQDFSFHSGSPKKVSEANFFQISPIEGWGGLFWLEGESLCHPWSTTTKPSYRFPIFETSATALCGTTGYIYIYHIKICIYIYIHTHSITTYIYIYI